jgi:hypothetical protein
MRKKKEDTGRKPINSKKKYIKSKNYNSIMKIHDDKMDELSKENLNKIIKGYEDEIKKNLELIETINREVAIKKINNTRYYDSESGIKIRKLLDRNSFIEKEIKYISSGDIMTDYILQTCHLINNYMELEETEKNLINKNEIDEIDDIEAKLNEINYTKNNITDEYMKIVDPSYVSRRNLNNTKDSLCDNCNIVLDISQGFASCSNCGASKQCLQQATELSYKEQQEMDYRPQFTYQKETHLDEWLRRFTAKEHKNIPQEVLDKVIMEAHKERIKDLKKLTEDKVKKYLKKLELNDYYDNVISIINRINNRPPFVLTQEIETKIKTMFQQIQAPFEKYKTSKRKNMISYSYILHQFFQILDLPEFSKYFSLLKSADKLRQNDEVFKKIVEEMAKTDPKTNWRFFPCV